MIKCPRCQKPMQEISGFFDHGTKVLLNRCSSCRGLWFNSVQLWQLSYESAKEISRIGHTSAESDRRLEFSPSLADILTTASKGKGLICPGCSFSLKKFSDTSISEELGLDYCPFCNGYWLEDDELVPLVKTLKEKQEEQSRQKTRTISATSTDNPSIANTNSIEENNSSADYYDTIYYEKGTLTAFWIMIKDILSNSLKLIKRFFSKKNKPSKKNIPSQKNYKRTKQDCGIVYLNSASLEDLCSIPMLSISVVKKIIDYRKKHGAFIKKTDLLKVHGLSPVIYSRIKDIIAIDKIDPPEDRVTGDRKLEL